MCTLVHPKSGVSELSNLGTRVSSPVEAKSSVQLGLDVIWVCQNLTMQHMKTHTLINPYLPLGTKFSSKDAMSNTTLLMFAEKYRER